MKKLFTIMGILILTGTVFAFPPYGNSGMGNNGMGGGTGTGTGTGICDGTGSGSGQDGSGNGMFGGQGTSYDLTTVVTVTGEIIDFYNPSGIALYPHNVVILSEGIEYVVQTGPAWYMENQGLNFEIGQVITVTGSLTQNNYDDSVILAAEIILDDMTFVLRDELGVPMWQAMRGTGSNQNGRSYINYTYDVTQEIVITGTVQEVIVGTMEPGTYPGYQMLVDTIDGAIQVVLGPYWFLSNQGFDIEMGVEVNMTGVNLEREDGTTVFIVRIMTWSNADGDYELILRDENGLPLWNTYHEHGRN